MREHGHAHRHCTPTLALPLKGGGRKISTAVTVEPFPPAEPGVYLKLN